MNAPPYSSTTRLASPWYLARRCSVAPGTSPPESNPTRATAAGRRPHHAARGVCCLSTGGDLLPAIDSPQPDLPAHDEAEGSTTAVSSVGSEPVSAGA